MTKKGTKAILRDVPRHPRQFCGPRETHTPRMCFAWSTTVPVDTQNFGVQFFFAHDCTPFFATECRMQMWGKPLLFLANCLPCPLDVRDCLALPGPTWTTSRPGMDRAGGVMGKGRQSTPHGGSSSARVSNTRLFKHRTLTDMMGTHTSIPWYLPTLGSWQQWKLAFHFCTRQVGSCRFWL